MDKVLLVEDDPRLREALSGDLTQAGYQVSQAHDRVEALELARAEAFRLIVVDVTSPELDGISLCRALRSRYDRSTSIMIITERNGEWARIIEQEDGADDYVIKPFSQDEFLARVRLALRRASTTRLAAQVESGNLSLDLRDRRVRLNGQPLKLSHKEFGLLAVLMQNRGAVLSRDHLMQHVWGCDHVSTDRTVDVHVRWLREKIEAYPSDPQRIVTVRGVGYCFEG